MKTILVTGGAGFIGSSTIERLLKEGYNIINIDNFNDYYDPSLKEKNISKIGDSKNHTLFRVDITHYNNLKDIFRNNKIDAVIHLAARAGVRPSLEDPILYQNVNGLGTQNILELCNIYNVKKLILASSSSVYGNNTSIPFKESDIVDYAISPYAATKKANEVMGHVYHKLYNMDMCFLRFFTVYGPKQRPDLAINKFISKILNNEPIELYGDGSTFRDYTYIDDIVDGIISTLQYTLSHDNVYEIFNIGSSNPISLSKMVKVIENVLDKKAEIRYLPLQPGDVNQTHADISKLTKFTDYKPKFSFEQGIKNFVDWKYNN